MRRMHSSAHAFLLALSACLSACGNEPAAKTPTASKFQGVHRYYPFETGMQWSYTVSAGPGIPGMLVVDRVVVFDGKTCIIQRGNESRAYELRNDGIVQMPSGSFLLKWPATLGDKWPGKVPGAAVEVTKVDAKITVEAGTFEGCIETTEVIGGDDASMLRQSFCPDVGPVSAENRLLHAPPGEPPSLLMARLRAYGQVQNIAPPETK